MSFLNRFRSSSNSNDADQAQPDNSDAGLADDDQVTDQSDEFADFDKQFLANNPPEADVQEPPEQPQEKPVEPEIPQEQTDTNVPVESEQDQAVPVLSPEQQNLQNMQDKYGQETISQVADFLDKAEKNPAEARQFLLDMQRDIALERGDILPDNLQALVDDNVMTVETANQLNKGYLAQGKEIKDLQAQNAELKRTIDGYYQKQIQQEQDELKTKLEQYVDETKRNTGVDLMQHQAIIDSMAQIELLKMEPDKRTNSWTVSQRVESIKLAHQSLMQTYPHLFTGQPLPTVVPPNQPAAQHPPQNTTPTGGRTGLLPNEEDSEDSDFEKINKIFQQKMNR